MSVVFFLSGAFLLCRTFNEVNSSGGRCLGKGRTAGSLNNSHNDRDKRVPMSGLPFFYPKCLFFSFIFILAPDSETSAILNATIVEWSDRPVEIQTVEIQ